MYLKKHLHTFFLFFGISLGLTYAQIPSNVYRFQEINDGKNKVHDLIIGTSYFIHTIYEESPPRFIETKGGFYQVEDTRLVVLLAFNSAYAKDSVRQLSIPFELRQDQLVLDWDKRREYTPLPTKTQDLDGAWLFATRGPDEGQERRGEENPRKTLKFLMDGRFQWIAYQTETMRFSGTGGGSFSSINNRYTEEIEFFSRDNARVGASLTFDYKLIGEDWHHTGKNSKGKALYEIWARRN